MKYLALIVTAFITLSVVSSADTIEIEIIEFDCSAQPSLFDEYSQLFNNHDPASKLSTFDKLRSSELPQKVLLKYQQVLPENHQITQTTEINGSEFDIVTSDAEQSGLMNIKLCFSTQINGTELKNSKQTALVVVYGDTMIVPNIESSSQTANGEVTDTRKITITRIAIESNG